VLAGHCNLKLPNETVGAKRTREPTDAVEAAAPPSLSALEAQVREADAAYDASFKTCDKLADSLKRAEQQLENAQSEPHVSAEAFHDAEWDRLAVDEQDKLLDHRDDWSEWYDARYDAVEARWWKTPVGRVSKKVRDLQRELAGAQDGEV